jgi:HD-GYP domain-containing protein (c-di-GMP phosphodiesterase class II)
MKTIEVTSLKPGMVAPFTCYSENGNLLLSKGVVISRNHIDVLVRRNILTIFGSENEDEEEMRRLLKTSLQKRDALKFDSEAPSSADSSAGQPVLSNPPPVLVATGLKDIQAGEDGYKQLLANSKTEEVENRITRDLASDKPIGPPLASKARQMKVSERTPQYKDIVATTYASALAQSREILLDIVLGKFQNSQQIKSIVERFVRTFISDKNILLNISTTKHSGEEYFFNHALNVCLLAINISAAAGYSEPQVVEIGMGAFLHDIGMLLVPHSIRLKQDKLTEDEFFEVRKHPILGLHIIERIQNLPSSVSYIVYQSHERENGKGYPKQRVGRFIHNYAKIVQLADIYESMSSPRPYRSSYLPYKAMETLIKMAHEGTLNMDFVKSFLTYTSLFPVGSMVELNDNRIGKVIQSNGTLFAKPVVSVLAQRGVPFEDKSKIYQEDLKKSKTLQIIRPVPGDVFKGIDSMDGF